MSMRDASSGALSALPSMRPIPMKRFYGGGGLLSTPNDYTRFLQCLVNGGVLDGVRILSKNSVESFFSNQLPEGMTLKHPLVEAFNRPFDSPQRTVFDEKDTHSYAWTIESNPSERGKRPQGVVHGQVFTIHTIRLTKMRRVVVVAFMQLLPFNDGDL